jgi:CRP/FNR family transcriptional regulator, cyclic AMP receptor protein
LTSLTDIGLLEFVGTCFDEVAVEALHRLLEGSRRQHVQPGMPVFPVADPAPHVAMVLSGTARSFLKAADGRQLTVRYARRGALIGKFSGISGDHAPLTVQAITECTVLEFDVSTLDQVAGSDISMATAINAELVRRLEDIHATVANSVFGSMRQRLVRHLLAMADDLNVPRTFVRVTQQQLADGVGTSREVVARTLATLRNEGLLRTSPREIEILDVRQLSAFLGEWRNEQHRPEPDLFAEAQRLLKASPNAVVAVDTAGTVVFANSSVERVFGWSPPTLVGQSIEVLVPEALRALHSGHRAAFQERPEPRAMGGGRELHGLRRDGTEFRLAGSLTTIDTRDGLVVVATIVELAPGRDGAPEAAAAG